MNFKDRQTYRVKKSWQWITILAGPLLAALMFWGIREIILNYLAGKGSPLWAVVLIVLFLGVLGLVFLGSILWALRSNLP